MSQVEESAALDLGRYLGGCTNKVKGVGVELEGRWEGDRRVQVRRDGSVQFGDAPRRSNSLSSLQTGRVVMSASMARDLANANHNRELIGQRLLTPEEAFGGAPQAADLVGEVSSPVLQVKELAKWVKDFYPNDVNASCGLHIHMSFKTAYLYQTTMTPAFPASIIKYLKLWGSKHVSQTHETFWSRLEGRSTFCRNEFHADYQHGLRQHSHSNARDVRAGVPSRYTAVNYTWGMFRTVEVRVLPMFADADTSIAALLHVLDITNAFLAAKARDKQAIEIVTEMTDPPTIKEIHSCA